jgi:hypothetical protein
VTVTVETAGPATAEPRAAANTLDRLTWLLIGLALLPLLVEAVHILRELGDFHATTDNALNEMIVRDLGRHLALVGPYARSDWSHPGPLMFYVLALPFHLFGRDSAAMLVGALVVNAVAIGTMIAIARRWGGHELAIPVALVLLLIVVRLPHGYVADPWNPAITVLPFGAFLALAWASTCGDRWAFPAAVFAGTFCMQTHIGYVSLVLPVLAWCGWRVWRDHARAALVWGGAVLAVLWALPAFQQVFRTPGNVSQIVHYFRTSDEAAHSVVDAWRLIASQFTVTADWIVGPGRPDPGQFEPAAMRSNPIPLLLVVFAVAVWFAWRRRGPLRNLAVVLLLAIAGGAIGLTRTLGPMWDYRLRWIWVVAGVCMAFSVAVGYRALDERRAARARRVIVALVLVGAVVLSGVGVANAVAADPPDPVLTTRTNSLTRQIVRHLPKRAGVVLLRWASFGSYIAIPGLMLRLDDAGIPVRLERDALQTELTFGRHRLYRGGPVRAIVTVAGRDQIPTLEKQPGARRIAIVHAPKRSEDLAAFLLPRAGTPLVPAP